MDWFARICDKHVLIVSYTRTGFREEISNDLMMTYAVCSLLVAWCRVLYAAVVVDFALVLIYLSFGDGTV